MRDGGLEEAIKAIGGVGALAKGLGVAQPSVSNWRRVPAERVLAVESLTGVSRHELRPDLYPLSDAAPSLAPGQDVAAPGRPVDEFDQLRAAEYGLLALLFFKSPTQETLDRVGALTGDASPLGMAHLALAAAARDITVEAVGRDYFDLFVGVGRAELLPYASYYQTGFLHERPLAAVRADYVRLGVTRDDRTREPEDHIGLLFDVMAGLCAGRFGAGPADQKRFFADHLAPWVDRFLADLAMVEGKPFHRAVGKVARVFMEIETEAFAYPA